MEPSDFTTENRVLILDANTKKYCWCSRDTHGQKNRKRLRRISDYFDTEQQAVDWINVHFINRERVKKNKKKDNVVPLFKSLKPLYEK
jgi:hypothetical protein